MVVLRGMISIQNIEKSFSGNPVLQDVSFDIPDGKICGVFGKSGIGKSTLAKVLCGVRPPDAGAVTLDGQTLFRQTIRMTAGWVSAFKWFTSSLTSH